MDLRTQNITTMDKQLPQAVELEDAILGAIISEKDAILTPIDILTPDNFYKSSNGELYKEILKLYEGNIGIDIFSLTNALRKANKLNQIGGPSAITELTNKVASTFNLENWCRVVKEKAILRDIIKIGQEITEKGYDDSTDAFELLYELEEKTYKVSSFVVGDKARKIGEAIPEVVKEMEKAQKNELVGVPSYKTGIDKTIGGYRNGDIIIKAARPGQGKTANALEEAVNQAYNGTPVVFFSLEMKRQLLLKRIYANKAEIITTHVNNGMLADNDWEKINQVNTWLEDLPLFIDDESFLTVMTLRSKLRKLVKQEGVQIAYVDYLQLMSPVRKHQNREGEISEISRGLKAIATELNIPIIALSQLNREVDKRQPPKPRLSDLRESGSLEQDASIVMFLYWPKSYNLQSEEEPDMIYELIYKNRHGALCEVELLFMEKYGKFKDYSDEQTEHEPF